MSLTTSLITIWPDISMAAPITEDAMVFANGRSLSGEVRRLSDTVIVSLQFIATVIVIAFVVYKAVSSKFAIGAILVALLVGGILLWGVWNIDTVAGWIGVDLGGNDPEIQIPGGGGSGGLDRFE